MRAIELSGSLAPAAARSDHLLGRYSRWSTGIIGPTAALLVIFFFCFAWPFLASVPDAIGGDVLNANRPLFSPGHPLGTDMNGNDIWSRLLHGGRTSLAIAAVVNLIGLLGGGGLGALSGLARGLTDSAIMRTIDVLISFPSLVLALTIAQTLGPSATTTVLALTLASVPAFARVARAATLRVREQPFMVAAALSGTPFLRILLRHVAPNILPQLVTFGMLGMGVAIIVEGALSFLGLGTPPPYPSWGNMLSQGQQVIVVAPTLVLVTSASMFVTILSFNILGERLRKLWVSD
jgi:peptide/nickel transport system permease protein